MPETLKLLASLFLGGLANQEPDLDRSLAVLHPVERIAYSDDWRTKTARRGPLGGHVFVVLGLGRGTRCEEIAISRDGVTLSSFLPTPIATPSSEGGTAGTYFEALVPRNAVSCRASPFVLAEWRITGDESVVFRVGREALTVDVAAEGTFDGPERPMLVGLSNSFLIKGHCRGYCRREVELGNAYVRLLRAHHLTPIQSWIRVPPVGAEGLDLDAGGEGSFRSMTMAPGQRLVGFPRASLAGDVEAYLRALEKTVHGEGLAGRAWVYVRDEPADLDALAEELALYRRFAPSVRLMVTTPSTPTLETLVDIFAPNLLRLGIRPDGKGFWPYVSCMGSCGPNRAGRPDVPREPGPDTGRPDFLIDRPAERLFAYFRELDRMDAGAGLYYHAVEGYRLGVDLVADPWNFGGNGDGLLLYPGRPGEHGLKRHAPLAGFRLKLIRHAVERFWN